MYVFGLFAGGDRPWTSRRRETFHFSEWPQRMKKAPLTTKPRPRNRSTTNGSELDTRQLLSALMAFKRGDFSARLPEDWTGVAGKIADTFNDVIRKNQRMTQEIERVGSVARKEARIT